MPTSLAEHQLLEKGLRCAGVEVPSPEFGPELDFFGCRYIDLSVKRPLGSLLPCVGFVVIC